MRSSPLSPVRAAMLHSPLRGAARRADVLGAIEFTGIGASPDAKVGTLSAGQRRLVEVARTVVGGVPRPRPGSVLLDGTELAGRRPERIRAAGVAIVPEGRRLLPDLSVDDNIRVATYTLSKAEAAAGRARALEHPGRREEGEPSGRLGRWPVK